jgi:hypothetical protein
MVEEQNRVKYCHMLKACQAISSERPLVRPQTGTHCPFRIRSSAEHIKKMGVSPEQPLILEIAATYKKNFQYDKSLILIRDCSLKLEIAKTMR